MDVLGHRIALRIGRDELSTWYRAQSDSTPYRDAPSNVVLRIFDEPEDDFTRTILDEARLGTSFQHPCVWGPVTWARDELACRVIGAEGWTFFELVGAGPLPSTTAVRIARDLCAANLYLETHDLGPCSWVPDGSRIVVGPDGAARVEEPSGARLPLGTPAEGKLPAPARFALFSPERVHGTPLTSSSVVREIGAALHAMLMGELSLLRDSTFDTLRVVLSEPPPSLADRLEDPTLAKLVDRACARAPHDRFPTLTELSAALEDVARRLGPPTQPPHERLDAPARLVPFVLRD